jgi:phage terminase large subunit GpA-like protein
VCELQTRSLRYLLPPEKVSVSEWAKRHRVLSRKDSARPGRWRSQPHQDAIMDAFTRPDVRRVVVMAASQVVGKSQMMNNVLARFIDCDPCNVMVVHPTIANAEKWSIGRLDPMISVTERLHAKITPRKSRSMGDRILHRQFVGGQMYIVGANAPADLAAQSVRMLLADEIDRFPASAGEEGDPLMLAEQRTRTYGDAIIGHFSTPTIEGHSRIAASYEESDQQLWEIRCPGCGHFFWPDAEHVRCDEDELGNKNYASARMVCPGCGEVWSEADRLNAVDAGRWRPRASFTGVAGFHINAFGCKGINLGDLMRDQDQARGNPERMKAFANLVSAKTYTDAGEAPPDWQQLYDRREPYRRGTVPIGGVALTAGADVQRDRIEVDVWAWGLNRQRWLIDHFSLQGSPASDDVWWALDEVLEERFNHESGVELKIDRLAIDTGDGLYTNDVNRWAWSHRNNRVVMPIKGSASYNRAAPITGPTKQDATINGRKLKNGVKLWVVAVDTFKSSLYKLLQLPKPTDEERRSGVPYPPGYVHTPVGTPDEWFKQLTAERLVTATNRKTGRTRREWQKHRSRNEALDMAVYAEAAAVEMGIDRWSERRWELEYERRGLIDSGTVAPPPLPEPMAAVAAASEASRATQQSSRTGSSGGWLSGAAGGRPRGSWLKRGR